MADQGYVNSAVDSAAVVDRAATAPQGRSNDAGGLAPEDDVMRLSSNKAEADDRYSDCQAPRTVGSDPEAAAGAHAQHHSSSDKRQTGQDQGQGQGQYTKPEATKPQAFSTEKPISRKPRRSVKFTVTKVEDAPDHPLENNSTDYGTSSRDTQGSSDASGQNESVTLDLHEPQGTSDVESAYGDTLTQTSITKLLSKKYKTYKTYRYEVSKKNQAAAEKKKEAKDQKPGLRKRLISRYESQDYDQMENSLFLKEQENEKARRIRKKWLARWFVSLLTGVGTALVATVIEVGIEYSTHYKFWALKNLVTWCQVSTCMMVPLVVWIGINCSLVFLGSLLVTCVEPQAAGSGIPQIKCYLNGVKIPGLLSLRALVAKSIGVILSVSGGLACGKEGPMIHSGAIVAAGISQGRSRVFKKDFKIFEYLRSDTERRDFVSGGAAAGVSAAFGAPVGGVLFSLEEGASFWNQSLTWRIVFASMVATFTVNVILSATHAHPADLSNPGLISFGHFPHITYQAIEIPIFLTMAVIGGLLGALFNGINEKLTVFRKRYLARNWQKILEAMIVAAISAVMGFCLIYLVDDCVPDHVANTTGGVNTEHGDNTHVKLHCAEGEHNVMSSIFFKTPEASLITILHAGLGSYTVLSLSLFASMYFLLACWTYGLSVSSGVFIPSLLTGAAWGRLVGMGVLYLFPEMGYDYSKHAKTLQSNNIGKYALIGAACQLGGTVRMTISLTVILIECTGDITFGLPIVMVLIIAKWVGDFFNTGLYDLHIQMMGIPLLPWEPPEMSYDITAKQVMNTPVHVLRTLENVDRILDVMENVPRVHSGFPVVDEYNLEEEAKNGVHGRLKGLILRSQLSLLLKHKVFVETENEPRQSCELRLEDFRDAYPQYTTTVVTDLTDEERTYHINLQPYMNPAPYTVPMNASLPRMFRLFRGLGLRHLTVVSDNNEVVGMVTRKDLAKYRLNAKGGSFKVQELHIHHD